MNGNGSITLSTHFQPSPSPSNPMGLSLKAVGPATLHGRWQATDLLCWQKPWAPYSFTALRCSGKYQHTWAWNLPRAEEAQCLESPRAVPQMTIPTVLYTNQTLTLFIGRQTPRGQSSFCPHLAHLLFHPPTHSRVSRGPCTPLTINCSGDRRVYSMHRPDYDRISNNKTNSKAKS